MIADLVLELGTVLERHGIHHKMAMEILRVQMHGDEDLVSVAPHPTRRFLADGKGLLRRDFAFPEALDSVVAHHFAPQAEATLYGHHLRKGVLPGAVDAADI